MCGICGFNFSDRLLIQRMTDSIAHRGPNAQGHFVDRNISLGSRRLSIIDLSESGNQPMFNEDKSVVLVYNGEIYNFKELRKSLEEKGHKFRSDTDTEVVVHAYEEFGTNFLGHFNGFFGLALYDSKKKILILARDRLGKKPIYYYYDGKKIVFSSEIKAILEDKTIRREVNEQALNKYLMFRYIFDDETIFRNIYRIKPGHMLLFDCKSKQITTEKYWDAEIKISERSEEEHAKTIIGLFRDSVSKRLMSDVPLGVYLSGGIDSSSVVAMMKQLGVEKIDTYSVGFEHDIIGSELEYARKASELFETKHHEFMISPDIVKELPRIVWHLDEPLADPAVVPVYFLSKKATKSVTVILTGDGADELYAGYDQYRFMSLGNRIRNIPRPIRRAFPAMVKIIPKSVMDRIYKYSSSTGSKMYDRFGKFISSIGENKAKAYIEVVSVFDEEEKNWVMGKEHSAKPIYDNINNEFFKEKGDFLNRLTYLDLKTYLPEDLLMKPDKMCMAFSIEARVPFLDYRLVEHAFTIPSRLKLKGNTSKYIMKKSFRELLPKEILHRKKQPFQVPLDQWMSKELMGYFRDLLDSKATHQYFDKNYIRKIFDNYESSKLFYGRQLWSLGIFNIWHKLYIENEKLPKL